MWSFLKQFVQLTVLFSFQQIKCVESNRTDFYMPFRGFANETNPARQVVARSSGVCVGFPLGQQLLTPGESTPVIYHGNELEVYQLALPLYYRSLKEQSHLDAWVLNFTLPCIFGEKFTDKFGRYSFAEVIQKGNVCAMLVGHK